VLIPVACWYAANASISRTPPVARVARLIRTASAIVTLGIAAALGLATPAVAQDPLPRLQTSGRSIQTVDGQNVLLRGANVLRSEWDRTMSHERQAVPLLASQWRGNIILRGFAADPVNARDATYLSWLDEYVRLGRANRLYVAFVFRSYPINGSQPNSPDSRATRALTYLAQRYRSEPHVILGLQVEPHNVSWSALRPVFEGMVDEIRGANGSGNASQPLILVPGVQWSNDISGAIHDPVRRANVVYKTHPYIPRSAWQRNFIDTHNAGLPIHIGEFTLDPNLSLTLTEINALLAWARDNQVGWTAWIFDTCGCTSGSEGLITSWSTATPRSPYGTAVRDEMLTTPPIPGPGEPPPPPTPTVTRIDDNTIGSGDNQFSYSPGWSHASASTGCTDCSGKYQQGDHYTFTTGSYFTLRFRGRKVALYARKAPWQGTASVSLDGGPATTVSFVASTVQEQQLIYSSPMLPAGSHTVRVTRNASANQWASIVADRADVTD
jgi:hypothetical protein